MIRYGTYNESYTSEINFTGPNRNHTCYSKEALAKAYNKLKESEKEVKTMSTNNTTVKSLATNEDLDNFINETIDSLADHNERLEDLEQSISTVIEDNENLVENSIWPMQDDIKKVGILSLIACGLSGLSILALLFRRK